MNRMNILLIHADQHRQDCLGAYGNQEIKTPNIDGLARSGVLYKNSYCPFPICTPSRYSMLSGMYPHQHLSVTNHCTLPEAVPTFVKLLRDQGYHTAAVGKMHFTPTYLDVGFEEMLLAEQDGEGRFDDDYHRELKEKGLADVYDLWDEVARYRKQAPKEYWDSYNANASCLEQEDYTTGWIGARARERLSHWDQGGHMMMVGFVKPHFPYDPPKPWSGMYDPARLTLLPGWTKEPMEEDLAVNPGRFPHRGLTEENMRKIQAYYYASISQIDDEVGKMISLLKDKGIYDNTMIIYTSDHGDFMGYHHMVGKKNHFYDPVIKTPLIIKYPGQTVGETVERMVNNVDLAPTILKAAMLKPAETMAGQDLRDDGWTRDFVISQLVCDEAEGYMIRTERYKLMLYRQSGFNRFHDLEADPYELHNLYRNPDYQKLIEEYREKLMRFVMFDCPPVALLNENAPTCPAPNVPASVEENRREVILYYEERLNEGEEMVRRVMES